MQYVVSNPKLGLVLLFSLIVTACSPPESAVIPADAHHYLSTIDITEDAIQADIEQLYGGNSVLFEPDLGFAVLGFSQAEGELVTLAKERNQDAFEVAEAQGRSAWASGRSVWADGRSAWASGKSVWASGLPIETYTYKENLPIWDLVNLQEAHDVASRGGKGITVAVIDTGIDLNHQAFEGRLAPSSTWKDFVDGDSYPMEGSGVYYGHGTAVAGIIAQVAPNAKILPIRVLKGDGRGDMSDVILAIKHAVRQGADIINLSLGTAEDSKALKKALKFAYRNYVYVASSAGNGGQRALSYPAAYGADKGKKRLKETIVSVASVDNQGKRSFFTNYGFGLDIMAPGESIHTLFPRNRRAAVTGTSFSAPLAAGAMALLLSESRSFEVEEYLADLVNESANASKLKKENSEDILDLGYGLLDIGRYLQDNLY